MLALERGVGDLKLVEDAHLDVVSEVRKRAGQADEPHLAFALQFLERFDGTVFF